jgi:hypothetical protein
MISRTAHRILASVLVVTGAGAGLLTAVVLTLNLHIMVGLEQGYQASPQQVLDFSSLLLAVDLVLLVALPTTGVLLARWLLRAVDRVSGASEAHDTSTGQTVVADADVVATVGRLDDLAVTDVHGDVTDR